MRAYTYVSPGTFAWMDKPKPVLQHPRDAIVRVTLASICTSDLHIKHGAVPRAVPGITLGHEMVGIVEEVGSSISRLHPGDRVAVNVETFCGDCFFCRHGYVNNCTDPNGGWALGCRIDGGQAEYVRVPYADQGLHENPGWGVGSAGPFRRGLVGHRFLGHQDLPHYARGHGSPSRCRAHRVVYPPMYPVKTAQGRHCL